MRILDALLLVAGLGGDEAHRFPFSWNIHSPKPAMPIYEPCYNYEDLPFKLTSVDLCEHQTK